MVEIAFACQTYVSLPTASVKTIVHAALSRLKDAALEERMDMEFNIQAADVKVGDFWNQIGCVGIQLVMRSIFHSYIF